MKRGILALVVFILISGCTEPKLEDDNKNLTGKLIEVYVYEDINDSNSLKETHIADVTISNQGELGLVIIKNVSDISRLKSALEEIRAKEGLLLEYEDRVGGTYYLKSELVSPTDPRYIYALEGELALSYGFRAGIR